MLPSSSIPSFPLPLSPSLSLPFPSLPLSLPHCTKHDLPTRPNTIVDDPLLSCLNIMLRRPSQHAPDLPCRGSRLFLAVIMPPFAAHVPPPPRPRLLVYTSLAGVGVGVGLSNGGGEWPIIESSECDVSKHDGHKPTENHFIDNGKRRQ